MSRRFCTCGGIEGLGRLAMMVAAIATAVFAASGTRAWAQSDSHRQEGVTLRLVVLAPDDEGLVRGALSVDLEPGWKTYWIAPGPVGLAPQLDLGTSAGIAEPRVLLPVPIRFSEGEVQSVGYDGPVAFAIDAKATAAASILRANVLLGVCREICVPVQATLEAKPTQSLSDRALVARARADAAPETGAPGASTARWNEDRSALLVRAAPIEGKPVVDAFASAEGWSFGAPEVRAEGENAVLSLPVLSRPSATADLGSVDLLLTTAETAQLSRAVPVAPR